MTSNPVSGNTNNSLMVQNQVLSPDLFDVRDDMRMANHDQESSYCTQSPAVELPETTTSYLPHVSHLETACGTTFLPTYSLLPSMLPTSSILSNTTSPATTYNPYSSTETSVDPSEIMKQKFVFDVGRGQIEWSQSIQQSDTLQTSHGHNMLIPHDGLPTYAYEQHCANASWNYGPHLCATQLMRPSAMSPQDPLTIDAPIAMSTSGSSQGTSIETSDCSPVRSSHSESTDYHHEHKSTDRKISSGQCRRTLPSEPLYQRREVPVMPSNDVSPETSKKSKEKDTSKSALSVNRNESLQHSTDVQSSVQTKHSNLKKIEPKPTISENKHTIGTARKLTRMKSTTSSPMDKNDFLVQSKLAGMSYKEIRRLGKFTEAESTLRGRFRTLTKHKTARVRKPEWDDNDVSMLESRLAFNSAKSKQLRLLKKAVRKLSPKLEGQNGKIPWKLVAEYIAENGGSYHFGNATCRKRWDELLATEA